MAKNFLKFSGLTYDSIISQINDRLNSDERFANFRESAIAQTMVEIFAGTVDLVSYYLERRSEENFFDTARLRSSVILLSRQLGYVVQRPVPAEAQIKIKLKGNWVSKYSFSDTSTIQIPAQSVFTYGGLSFILKKSLTLNWSDWGKYLNSESGETPFITFDGNGDSIGIAQGEIKEKIFEGNTNPQIGSTFQLYRIDDTEFSNRYAEEDFEIPLTKVWIGESKEASTEYDINRRSLIDWEVIEAANIGETVDVCVIRTSITEGVEILFGDGRFAQYGAQTSAQGAITSNDNIYIQYFATKGEEANQVGAKDKKLQFSGKVYNSNGEEVTSDVEFYFKTNITGGADMESIDSIRVNAPNIYYSLDRLVAKRDYEAYLKSLSSPIDIKNAIAWGEQEELLERGRTAMIRMFNIVFFSVVGPLYQTSVSPYYVKTKSNGLNTSVLDYNFDEDNLNQRNYFNVFTKGDTAGTPCETGNLIEQLRDYTVTTFNWVLEGIEIPTSANGDFFAANYSNGMTFNVNYTTNISDNNNSLSGSAEVTINASDMSSLDNYSNLSEARQTLASFIQGQLRDVDDDRGISNAQNSNKGEKAFPLVVVSATDDSFVIIHDVDDPCYVINFSNLDDADINKPADDLGFTSATFVQPQQVNISRSLSKDIVDVVDDLNARSQVTIRNIYISPVIQNMKLEGRIYLKDLYDKTEEKIKIEDAIYEWLNNNADFNVEIYISNLIELIEQFPSVLYADVRFVPDVPVNPSGGSFYVSGNHSSIENATVLTSSQKTVVYGIVDSELSDWLGILNTSDLSGIDERNVEYSSQTVQSYDYSWNRNINERTFLETFARNVYSSLIQLAGNYTTFADSENFIDLISDIRKDYIYIIRFNLIDTNGNIGKDVQTVQSGDDAGKPIKGGYSLGNEIVKIKVTSTYEYKR